MKSPATYTENEFENKELLKVRDFKVWFPIKSGILQKTIGNVKAIDGISFTVKRGEILGVVGESGYGKTTLAKGILRLVKPPPREKFFLKA